MSLGNSIKDRFLRSWEISKNTFQVMRKDKEILLFPVLSSIFSLILLLIFVFPSFLALLSGKDGGGISLYLGILAFYFATTFTAIFFNVGTVHIAKTRFQGGDATFMDGLKAGLKHLRQIIGWALLSATVGLLLNILQGQARERKGIVGILGMVLVSLIGFVWAIVSIFVVPAIVIKNQGVIEALKSSALAIKKTWGENLIKHYGLGLVQGLFSSLGIIFILIPGILLLSTSVKAGISLIGIFVLYSVMLSIVFSSAKTIFDTALFIYADSGKVPRAYSEEEMKHAFVENKRKQIG